MKWLAFAVVGTLATAACADTNAPAFPVEKRVAYRDLFGSEHVYLVQEPVRPVEHPTVLIYMHGAGGLEEQGMDPKYASESFTRLRALMDRGQWIYVCPRDADFPGLLTELRKKYKPETIVLAGASAGGRTALAEANRDPKTYAGLILLCPAISPDSDASKLSIPVWIVTAEEDTFITQNTRQLVGSLERTKKRYRYVEIPGGGHDTPVREVEWEKALRFLLEIETPLTPK